jgi:GNAT superfamily N-acetyltransferase
MITIRAFYNNDQIGYCNFMQSYYTHEDFENEFSEEEYDKLFYGNNVYDITFFEIDTKYKSKGYAKPIFKYVLNYIIDTLKADQIYLNACPITIQRGLNMNDLIGFYESFGFNIVLDQGYNKLMIKNIK